MIRRPPKPPLFPNPPLFRPRTQVAPPLPPPPFSGTNVPGLYQVVQRDTSGRETTTFFAANFHEDRKSTRLNSSHVRISYAVFCLTQKKLQGQCARLRQPDTA